MTALLALGHQLRPHRRLLVQVVVVSWLQLMVGAAVAVLSVLATTAVLTGDGRAPLLLAATGLAVGALGWLAWTESWVAHVLAYRVIDTLRLAVHAALARLAPLGLGRRRSGDTAAAAMADAEQLEWFFAHTVAQAVAGVAAAAALLAVAAGWLGAPAMLLLVAQVLVVAVPRLGLRRAERQGERLRAQLATLSADVVEIRQAARDLVLLGRLDDRLTRVRAGTLGVQRARRALALRAGLEQAAIEAVVATAAVFGIVWSAALVRSGDLASGLLPVAVVLLGAGLAPCLVISSATLRLGEMSAAAARVDELRCRQDHPAAPSRRSARTRGRQRAAGRAARPRSRPAPSQPGVPASARLPAQPAGQSADRPT